MKALYKQLMLIALLAVAQAVGGAAPANEFTQRDSIEQARFSQHAKIARLIAIHLDEVITNIAKEYSWLPGYYLKRGSDRIEGAAVFQQCIDQHKLKLVKIPEKWLCPVTQKQLNRCSDTFYANRYLDDPHVVVSKKVNGVGIDHCSLINIEQAKELFCLLQHAKYHDVYYSDIHAGNLFMCDDGKVAIVDTETRGFRDRFGLLGTERLLDYNCLTSDARVYLQKQLMHMRMEQLPK